MTSPRHPAPRCPNAARGVVTAGRGEALVTGRRYWFGYWFSTGVPVAMS